MQHIQKLVADRTGSSASTELYEQLYWLEQAVDTARQEKPPSRLWTTLMNECGLAGMYVRLVQTDGFFNEPVGYFKA